MSRLPTKSTRTDTLLPYTTLFRVLEWSFASAALYWLLPLTVGIDFWHFIGIFVIAYLAGMVSNVPGGLGVFESVTLLLLPEHVAPEGVVAAIITYRAIYFVLPLLVAAAMFGAYEPRQGPVPGPNLPKSLPPNIGRAVCWGEGGS